MPSLVSLPSWSTASHRNLMSEGWRVNPLIRWFAVEMMKEDFLERAVGLGGLLSLQLLTRTTQMLGH